MLRPLRDQNDGKGMIPVHPQQHIGEDGDVFGGRVPFVREICEIGENPAIFALQLAVNQCALACVFLFQFNVVVIFQAGIAVQAGMHPGQMIAFAVVLHCQLPVARDLKRETAVRTAVIERFVKLGPAGDEVGVGILKGGGGAGDVDEHHIHPDMAADLDQAQERAVDPLMRVLARAAHMGRADQAAIGGIAPAVIGAANGPFDFARCIHQNHAAMAAGVLEHPDLALFVPHHQKRHAQERQGHRIANLWHIRRHPKTRPLIKEHRLAFFFENACVNVMGVGQAMRVLDALADLGKIAGVLGHRILHQMRRV